MTKNRTFSRTLTIFKKRKNMVVIDLWTRYNKICEMDGMMPRPFPTFIKMLEKLGYTFSKNTILSIKDLKTVKVYKPK